MALPLLHGLAFKAVFKGADIEKLSLLAEEFLDENLKRWESQEIVKRLNEAKKQGHYTALLSNSPDFFVQIVAKKIGFDYCKGSVYQVVDNKLDKVAVLMGGDEKARTMFEICEKESIPKENSSAYTDCLSDLSLLQAVGNPFAVNPSARLKKYCKQNNWGIILTR